MRRTSRTSDIPDSRCPQCGHAFCEATNFEGERPVPGAVSLCIECGHLMVFDKDLSLREPTKAEAAEAASNRAVIEIRIAIWTLRAIEKGGDK